jgi:hypothetical protein
MDWIGLPFLIPIVAIIGAFTYAIVNSAHRARVRELEIRERIAMIERGMVPAPEADPKGFDHAIDRLEKVNRIRDLQGQSSARHRRAGITLIGVGLGLMVLITFAGGSPEEGFGVGGFLAILGIAFFINSLFELRQSSHASAPTAVPPANLPPPPAARQE